MQVGIYIAHFPKFNDSIQFTKQLVVEQAVFCLPGEMSMYLAHEQQLYILCTLLTSLTGILLNRLLSSGFGNATWQDCKSMSKDHQGLQCALQVISSKLCLHQIFCSYKHCYHRSRIYIHFKTAVSDGKESLHSVVLYAGHVIVPHGGLVAFFVSLAKFKITWSYLKEPIKEHAWARILGPG